MAEEAEGEEGEDEARAAVPEEAWAAARPSRNKELQVTVVAAIIIIMVIILTHLNTELLPSKRKYWSQQLIGCGFFVGFFFPKSRPISGLHSGRNGHLTSCLPHVHLLLTWFGLQLRFLLCLCFG